MNQVLMLLVLCAASVLLVSLVLWSLAAVVSPAGARPVLRAVLARIVCPETGVATRVGLGVIAKDQGAVPDVLTCERFPSGVVTCDRGCLVHSEITGPPMTSLALASGLTEL
jgi:hypothetical protein